MAEDVRFVRSICEEVGAMGWDTAVRDRLDDLWRARLAPLPAYRANRVDLEPAMLGDVVVPISAYPELVAGIEAPAEEADLLVPTVGYAGHGNLHFTPLVAADDTTARERAIAFGNRVTELALELGGSVTGEHAVGPGKRKLMVAEHGEALNVMRTIKAALDHESGEDLPRIQDRVDGTGEWTIPRRRHVAMVDPTARACP